MRLFKILLMASCLCLPSLAKAGEPDWNEMADGMAQALVERFWGASFEGQPERYYFNYGSDQSEMTTEHYWPQAHAMDVLVDAYTRTGDKRYKALFPLWWEGAPKFNPAGKKNPKDPWWNVYVDDMEWMVLAQIRMFEATGNRTYVNKARQMYDDWIWTAWGPENESPWYGGITWKTDVSKSKNACSNGPASLIAVRLYNFYDKAKFKDGKKKEAYLNEAIKIHAWEKNYLFNRETGAVYDNINKEGKVQKNWIFTYNSGTFLGTAHELFRVTGDRQYLDDAVLAADYVIENLTKDGVLSDAAYGDGGLFHGIFFRYFVKLANEKALDKATRLRFHDHLTKLATTMAAQGVNKNTMLYGGRWRQAPADNDSVCLTAHLTGCMLMEAMCVLEPVE